MCIHEVYLSVAEEEERKVFVWERSNQFLISEQFPHLLTLRGYVSALQSCLFSREGLGLTRIPVFWQKYLFWKIILELNNSSVSLLEEHFTRFLKSCSENASEGLLSTN